MRTCRVSRSQTFQCSPSVCAECRCSIIAFHGVGNVKDGAGEGVKVSMEYGSDGARESSWHDCADAHNRNITILRRRLHLEKGLRLHYHIFITQRPGQIPPT